MRTRFFIAISLFILLVCYGCGGSPEIERTQAREAMDKANSLHVDKFAPTEFQQAQKAWDHGQAAEKEGNTSTAKVLYASAKIFFGKAADIAKTKKAALSRELTAMQLVIGENLAKVKADLLKGGLPPRLRDQVETIASQAEEDNASIRKLADAENFPKAIEMAKNVQTNIYHAQLILAGR
jgi:hypothetical protein